MKQYEIRLLDHEITCLSNRIAELIEGEAVCTDPVRKYNMQDSIAILSEKLTKLCDKRNNVQPKPYLK